jgi:hypothetical protein
MALGVAAIVAPARDDRARARAAGHLAPLLARLVAPPAVWSRRRSAPSSRPGSSIRRGVPVLAVAVASYTVSGGTDRTRSAMLVIAVTAGASLNVAMDRAARPSRSRSASSCRLARRRPHARPPHEAARRAAEAAARA